MRPVPKIIGGMEVILFTLIDERHRSTGACKHTVAGKNPGQATGLAICRDSGGGGYYLFGCDEHWFDVTDTWHPSVEGAMSQAEFEYEGVGGTWQHLSR